MSDPPRDALAEAVARGLVSPDEAASLRREAETAGMDVGELLARRGLAATTQGEIHPPELNPGPESPPGRTPVDPAYDRTVVPKKPGNPLSYSGRLATGFFGRYQILGEIARGGVGVVHRARQVDADRTVAIKVLLAGDFASDIEERRFLREAETASQLHHPNIVGVYDIGREHGRVYYTMELVDGKPLGVWGKGRTLEEKLRVFVKTCRAAHVAHMKGVIHRDLKPGNVLVTPESEPKVLDFGLAKLSRAGADSLSTMTGQTLGTPYYMSPEQAAGRIHDIDLRSDVWALGVILFELVSGNVPFPGTELTEVLAKIDRDDPAPFVGPADLRLIVLKALEKERSRRYPSAEALAEDVDRFLAGEPVSARPPSIPFLARRWAKRHPASVAAAAAACLVLAAVGLWQLWRPGEFRFDVSAPGAWVEVDGKRVSGEARVPAGLHRVTSGADGYETLMTEAYVARGETRTLAYRLEPSTGTVRLSSDEDATVVEIGCEVRGLPFVDNRVPVGDYVLRFRSRGFETRERRIRVERNKETRAWVSMVPTGFHSGQRGNTFEAPILTGDMDGDGVPDVSSLSMQELFRLDGRTGGIVRATNVSDRVGGSGWCGMDWDGDGCVDDAVVCTTSRGVIVQVLSGREAGPAVPGASSPPQKRLWSTVLDPAALQQQNEVEPPVELAGRLWVAVQDGIRIFERGTGAEAPAIRTGGAEKPRLRRIAGGAGMLALTTGKLLRFAADGREVWSKEIPGLAELADRRTSAFEPASDGLVFACCARRLLALKASDGSVAWEESFPDCDIKAFVADDAPVSPRTIFVSGAYQVQGRDAATGRQTLPPVPVEGSVWPQCAATDTALFHLEGGQLVCHDARAGGKLWTATLPSPATTFPAACDGNDGPEYWYATGDGRLLVMAAGHLAREVPLAFAPRQVFLRPLDADGRPDAILVGYGLQVVHSSRMLWKRRGTNTMRPRPIVFDAGGRQAVVEIGRWENGEKEARAFAADTGELLWAVGGEYDVMLEPALFDVDGDGTLDVLTQQQAKNLTDSTVSFVALNGRDGHLLKSMVIPFTPYPPAIRIDAGGPTPEFLVCPWNEGLLGFRFGDEKPVWKTRLDHPIFSTPLIFPGASPEARKIVAALAAGNPQEGAVAAWTLDGHELWTTPLPDITWGSPFLLDTDGDGTPEILVPGRNNIFVLSADGKIRATWNGLGGTSVAPALLPDGFVTGLRAGVARVRRDGTTVWTYPCAFVTGTLAVVTLPGSATPAVVGIDWNGRLFCLDAGTGAERWRVETGARCEHGVTVAEVGGVPVAFIGSDDFTLYAFDLR